MLPDEIQEVGGCNEIFWLHLSVGLLRVQRALIPNREQPAKMQVEAEDSPRQHVSSFWSNLPIEKKIMSKAAGLFCVCLPLANDPSCGHINLMEIHSFRLGVGIHMLSAHHSKET